MSTKKQVSITINTDWLLYDIMNETFLRGRAMRVEDNYKTVANVFASADEENREKILRSVSRAFAELQSALMEYLDEDVESENNTRRIDGATNLQLTLLIPDGINKAAMKGVGEFTHGYLKNTAIADWYMVTNKEDAAMYVELARRDMDSIMRAMSVANIKRVRIRQHGLY